MKGQKTLSVATNLQAAAETYAEAKHELEAWTGAGQELLHVHAGLLIFVMTALVLRKKFRSPVPLSLVASLALLNELIDWVNGTSTGGFEPLWDIANTVFWPGILFALARRWR